MKKIDTYTQLMADANTNGWNLGIECRLLNLLTHNLHTSGKIEGLESIDSSSDSAFCEYMAATAKREQLLNPSAPRMVCSGCYARRLAAFRSNVKEAHHLNMLILMNHVYSLDALKSLYFSTTNVRMNADGELANVNMAINYLNIAYTHPENTFTLWFKNSWALGSALKSVGKPSNLILIQSSFHIGVADERLPYADYTFTCYDTAEALESALESGASECNGKKCRDCGFKCYKKLWPTGTNIAEKFRR